jgi:hypothetical protein
VLNVAGGTLQQHYDGHFDLPRYNEDIHGVHLEPGSMLAKVMGAMSGRQSHPQAHSARWHRPRIAVGRSERPWKASKWR